MLKIWTSSSIDPNHYQGTNFNFPPQFDLDILGLPKIETVKYGLKQSVVFYDRHDGEKYFEPLARVIWKIVFEGMNPKIQQRFSSWALVEGGWSSDRESSMPIRNPKVFLQKRRERVIEELIDIATRYDMRDLILSLYEEFPVEVLLYKQAGSPRFRDAIEAKDDPTLDYKHPVTDKSPRETLIEYLSISVIEPDGEV